MTATIECRSGVSRHNLVGAACLLLIRDDKILMLRRANTGYADGSWAPPNGHLEFNESVKDAMIREAREEVGIEIRHEDLDVVHVMSRRSFWDNCDNSERVDFFLTASHYQGEPTNVESHKHDKLAWLKVNDLPSSTVPYICQAIRYVQLGQTYSEVGWDDVCPACGQDRYRS